MNEIHPNIDSITSRTDELMELVNLECGALNIDPSENYLKGVAWIGFRIGLDYFSASRVALDNEKLLSGTSLVRSSFENLGDLFYIYCHPSKKAKYAKSYVESMNVFTKVFILAKVRGFDPAAQDRALKQSNKWTDASIEVRLRSIGPSMLTVYDMMSYFSHPNPGALTYLDRPQLLSAQINLVKQCNCINAVNLMGLVINHISLTTVKHNELNAIATELGFPLMQAVDNSVKI
ncbi:MAG: hypothetical protein ABIQ64_02875 [Candidatus Saccharimonadales bacterium]